VTGVVLWTTLAHLALSEVLGLAAAAVFLPNRHRHGRLHLRPLHTLHVWARPVRRARHVRPARPVAAYEPRHTAAVAA
jgi:hypothetical protein